MITGNFNAAITLGLRQRCDFWRLAKHWLFL